MINKITPVDQNYWLLVVKLKTTSLEPTNKKNQSKFYPTNKFM